MNAEVEKASAGELRDARELADLKVGEVSIVDRPAIRRDFLIVKRLEEDGMTNEASAEIVQAEFDSALTEVTKQLTDLGYTFIEVDVEKAIPTDLKSSLGVVVPWMLKMAGSAQGDVRAAILRAAAFLRQAAAGKLPVPGKGDEEKEADKQKAKGKDDKAGNPFAPGGGGPGGGGGDDEEDDEMKGKGKKGAKGEEKKKALSLDDEPDAAAILKVDADGNLHIVTKGAKKLTGDRAKTLADAASQILGLLKETDDTAFKAALEAIMEKELPSNAKVPNMVKPMGMGGVPSMTAKSEDGFDVAGAFAEMQKRLDSIEKARSPSTSVHEGGGTEGGKEKVEKTFWSGVL